MLQEVFVHRPAVMAGAHFFAHRRLNHPDLLNRLQSQPRSAKDKTTKEKPPYRFSARRRLALSAARAPANLTRSSRTTTLHAPSMFCALQKGASSLCFAAQPKHSTRVDPCVSRTTVNKGESRGTNARAVPPPCKCASGPRCKSSVRRSSILLQPRPGKKPAE